MFCTGRPAAAALSRARRLALGAVGLCAMILPVCQIPVVLAQGSTAARVAVDAVREVRAAETVPVIGRLVSRRSGTVAAEIGGPITAIRADVGDRVDAGDILAVIDKERLALERRLAEADLDQARASVQVAEARRRQAELTLARLEGLSGSAAFSQARFEDAEQTLVTSRREVLQARAAAQRAEAELGLANLNLAKASIRAPFSGVITQRYVDVGTFVDQGDAIVDLLDDRALEIEADVPADRLLRLKPGTAVTARLEVDGNLLAAAVRAVVPAENPRTRTRPVRFALTGSALGGERSTPLALNQSMSVLIPAGPARPVLSVHKDAVSRTADGFEVVIATGEGTAQPRSIEIGAAIGNRFVVLDGVSAGELVVVRGNERLRAGQAIRFEEPS